MKKIELNEDCSQLLHEVSELTGIDYYALTDIIEYLLLGWVLRISKKENLEGHMVTIPIPYLGNIAIKYKCDKAADKGQLEADADYFVSIDSNFKHLLYDINQGDSKEISDFLKRKITGVIYK